MILHVIDSIYSKHITILNGVNFQFTFSLKQKKHIYDKAYKYQGTVEIH